MANVGVSSQSAIAQTLVNQPISQEQQVAQQQLNMVDADGNAILVPMARYQEAASQGAKLETNAQAAQRDLQEKYGDAGLRTFAESAASGATLGISDQILKHFSDDDGYDLAARRAANVKSALAGEIAGTTATLLAGGGIAGAVEKGAAGLLGATAEGAGTLAKLGGLAARGAAEGTYIGAQKAISENALGNPEDFGELLFSQVGMNALLGGALSPLAHVGMEAALKGASKVGEGAGVLADTLKPLLPGFTQTVDPLTGEAIGGARAAIARKVNDLYASAAQFSPFSKVSKDDLVMALNNPEGRQLLSNTAVKEELEAFAKEAPTVLNNFKSDLLEANASVRQELKDYSRSLAQGVKEDSAEAASQLFKVRESIAEAQSEAQQKLRTALDAQTEPSKGLIVDVADRLQKTVENLSKNESVGKSYIQSITDALDTAVNAGAETRGQEILALRQFRSELGGMAFDKQLANLSVADRNATKQLQSLYGQVNDILRDPAKVGSEIADLLKVSDADYSKFAGLNKVFGDVTQRKVIQDTGQRTAVDSLVKASKNILAEEQNSRLVNVLQKASNITDADGQKLVQQDLIQGLKDIIAAKQTSAAVKTEVKDFLSSPGSKDYDSLVAKAQSLTGKSSEAQAQLSKLSGIQSTVEGLGDTGAFEKALAVQKGTGAVSPEQIQKLGTLKNLSSALGERESFLTGTAKEIATASRGHEGHNVSLTGLIGQVANPLAYLRAVDIAKSAVAKFQGEIVQSAIKAVTDASKPILVRGAILKADDYKLERDRLQQMQQNLPNQITGEGNPIIAAVPSEAVPSMMKTGGQAVQYLNSQLPRPPESKIGPFGDVYKDWKPTAGQMQAYMEKKAVVENPKVAIEALANGSITTSQVEAIKAVYPQLYNNVSTAIMQLADKMENTGISYSRNLAFAKWFGNSTSLSTAPSFISSMQSNFANSQSQSSDTQSRQGLVKPTATGLKNLDIASRSSTGLQSTLSREG